MTEEIIKLDRLKFMDAGNPAIAENFFLEISTKTGASIQWENGCKVAPFRKEPCIKLSGPADSVHMAKEMLLDRMEVQSNRIVMKIDITHFEHPSLIGKSGKLIKKVMESTGCHIHFPDSNKCPELEKSNLVSISGEPANVEKARVMLRALIPVQVFFELPATSSFQYALDPTSPETRNIERKFGLLLYSFMARNKIVVVLRCDQDKFNTFRKEIPLVIEMICGRKGVDLPPVYIITDIMPQHQHFVKGNNNCNIEDIKIRTGANISFPDRTFAKTMRNSVIISGNLDCVYMAWQDLMCFLPATVTFDVNYTRETRGENMNLLQDYGIILFTHPKLKYHVKAVTLKGPEKFSRPMIQYRQHLLRLPTLFFNPDIEHINLASKLLASTTEYFRSTYSAIPPSVADIISGENRISSAIEHQELIAGQTVFSETNFLENEDRFPDMEYQKLKMLAAKAMRRPIDSHDSTQVPSNIWSGYGFSQSMPAAVIKENLSRMNHYSYTDFDEDSSGINSGSGSSEDSESWESTVLKDCMHESIWSNKKDYMFSHSNYLDFLRGSTIETKSGPTGGILPDILWQNDLQKYSNLFIKQEVDYQTFLLLNDEDLQSIGIPFNARIKMLCLIRDLQEKTLRRGSKTFNAAPGAERKLDKSFGNSRSES